MTYITYAKFTPDFLHEYRSWIICGRLMVVTYMETKDQYISGVRYTKIYYDMHNVKAFNCTDPSTTKKPLRFCIIGHVCWKSCDNRWIPYRAKISEGVPISLRHSSRKQILTNQVHVYACYQPWTLSSINKDRLSMTLLDFDIWNIL